MTADMVGSRKNRQHRTRPIPSKAFSTITNSDHSNNPTSATRPIRQRSSFAPEGVFFSSFDYGKHEGQSWNPDFI